MSTAVIGWPPFGADPRDRSERVVDDAPRAVKLSALAVGTVLVLLALLLVAVFA